MEIGMKTMLGGWEDVQRLLATEQARSGSATPFASLSQRHCVALTPKENSGSASASRHFSLRETRVGGVSSALLPLPGAARLAPRHASRQQALTLPTRRHAASDAPGAARLARLALDQTCEIQEADFVLLVPLPPRPLPAPQVAAGLRRGGTLLEPDLHVVLAPVRRRGFVSSVVHWTQALLRALGVVASKAD